MSSCWTTTNRRKRLRDFALWSWKWNLGKSSHCKQKGGEKFKPSKAVALMKASTNPCEITLRPQVTKMWVSVASTNDVDNNTRCWCILRVQPRRIATHTEKHVSRSPARPIIPQAFNNQRSHVLYGESRPRIKFRGKRDFWDSFGTQNFHFGCKTYREMSTFNNKWAKAMCFGYHISSFSFLVSFHPWT